MAYDFAVMAKPAEEGGDEDEPEEKTEKKSLKEMTKMEPDEVLDMAIDQCFDMCGDKEMRRENFKRAWCLMYEAYTKESDPDSDT